MKRSAHVPMALAGAMTIAFLSTPARAAEDDGFYRGKNIDLVIGYTPGGLYDLYGRLVAQFMGEHIPGKPRIIPRNMPGGSSRTAAGFVSKVGPQDGTVMAVASQSLALEQTLGASLQFDMGRMQYIGNPNLDNNVIVTWGASGVRTLEDAMKRETTVGSTGDDPSSQYPKAANALLGTKFKIVMGYPGGAEIDLAMERGEVDGRGSSVWNSWKSSRSDWLSDKKINILAQVGLRKAPDLPDTPLLLDMARSDQEREVLRLLSAQTVIGKQIFVGPEVPAERVKILRDAFDATMKDPAMLAQAARQGLDIGPASGEELQKVVADMLAMPKAVTGRLVEILGPRQ